MAGITDRVRSFSAAVAAAAEHVRIDPAATVEPGGFEGLDPGLHLLEAEPEDRARYVLILDAVNFGSGWFDELGVSTDSLTAQLTEHARAGGVWSAPALRRIASAEVARVLGLATGHELTALYARSLNELGGWLGTRPALEAIGDSAEALVAQLARLPSYADHFFYKRAQITANDLVHAGVAAFADADRLTVFADNLLPHVLRVDGVLHYSAELAARIDARDPIPAGHTMEIELRACAVHACEGIAAQLGVPARTLDNWLWNRGQSPPYSELPAHRTRTVFY